MIPLNEAALEAAALAVHRAAFGDLVCAPNESDAKYAQAAVQAYLAALPMEDASTRKDEDVTPRIQASPTQPSSLVEALAKKRDKAKLQCQTGASWAFEEAISIVRQHESESPPRVDDEMVEQVAAAIFEAAICKASDFNDGSGVLLNADKCAKAAIAAMPMPRMDDEMVNLLQEVLRQLHPVMQRTTFHKVEAAIAALTTPNQRKDNGQ